jgi:hypothetical protein
MTSFEELRAEIKQDVTDELGDRARQHALMARLLVYLGGKFKESDPTGELATLMSEFQTSHEERERERFSVEEYFNGLGPVGKRVLEAVRLNQTIAGRHQIGAQMHTLFKEALAPFRIPIFKDPTATHELYHLIQEISMRVFGQSATLQIPSIPMHMGQILPENRVSNFYNVSAEDTITREPYSLVMLYAEIGKAWVCVDIRSTGRAQLMYYHSAEDVWLFNVGEFVLFDMVKHLKAEWAKLETQIADKLPNAHVSLPETMEALQVKVDRVFDNEHLIPDDARYYFRDKRFPTSKIVLRIKDLQVNLINTRGDYPSRNMYLIRGIEEVMSTRVKLEELSPLVQKQVIDAVEDVLDGYIGNYIDPKPKEPVTSTPFKFQNPVFNLYVGRPKE